MKTTSQFPNVTRRLKEKKLTIEKLASELGIGRCALSYKLSGKYSFTLDEALKIRDALDKEATVEELFAKIV